MKVATNSKWTRICSHTEQMSYNCGDPKDSEIIRNSI